VSASVFDIIGNAHASFDLRHKVLTEVYEELLSDARAMESDRGMDPYSFYNHAAISDLVKLLESGEATFATTGFGIELMHMVPEITTVLVVRDKSYLQTYQHMFRLSPEHKWVSQLLEVPARLADADEFLEREMTTDPESIPGRKGLDSSLWTIAGCFAFVQGLRKVVDRRLL
jgi:hypothetical protein